MPLVCRFARLMMLFGLVCLSLCAIGCAHGFDTVFHNVQDEHDISDNSFKETAAIIEAPSTYNPLTTQRSCFFSVPHNDAFVNTRKIIFNPGAREFVVTCNIDSILTTSGATYSRSFNIDWRDSGRYEIRSDGARINVSKQCLIVVDVSTDSEVARSCDDPDSTFARGICESLGLNWC